MTTPIRTDVAAAVVAAVEDVAAAGKRPILLHQRLDSLGIDSLDFVRLVQLIEEQLDITIDDETAAGVKTVAEMIALAEATLIGKDPPPP